MKLRRSTRPPSPAYPTRAQFRDTLATGLATAGLGALLAAPAAAQPSIPIRTAGVPLPPPPKDEPKPPQADTAQLVQQLASQLGSKDSRVREKASKALIALGIQCEQKDGQVVFPNKETVLNAMRALKDHLDPEIAQRADEVIRAVEGATAPPSRPPPPPALGGVIAVP